VNEVIFKAGQRIGEAVASIDGRLLALYDRRKLYVLDLEAGRLRHEEETPGFDTFRFDRPGRRLYVADGFDLAVLALPALQWVELPGLKGFKDLVATYFYDSKADGEALIWHRDETAHASQWPPPGALYRLDAEGRSCARIGPCPLFPSGRYLDPARGLAVFWSEVRLHAVVDLEGRDARPKLPDLAMEPGLVLGVGIDGAYAVEAGGTLVIRDPRGTERSRCPFPSGIVGHEVALSPDLRLLAGKAEGAPRVRLFDATTGRETAAVEPGDGAWPSILLFVPRGKGARLLAACDDGTVRAIHEVKGP